LVVLGIGEGVARLVRASPEVREGLARLAIPSPRFGEAYDTPQRSLPN
jgi:hypothetical protein